MRLHCGACRVTMRARYDVPKCPPDGHIRGRKAPMGFPSGSELWIVLVVVLLIFGASRLPLLGRNLGQGIKEFKKGVKEAARDDTKQVEDGSKNSQAQAPETTPDRRD